ncbi:tetratricopeptide repeat protein [Moorena producens JHB]|uniref:Tetratricopeptide repeat protein n=1 Tax=Moorena producens (strain JHB) TaxID=1454205 RepID=A0A1D9FVW6_MOOP1|nr:tetratricopeptide repeat protein [Moorena producens]AOY79465.1 tetratricopeptide repeat protein [Moorena producens JHB]
MKKANSGLDFALVRCRNAWEHLDCPKNSLSTEKALEILSARDALQKVLKTQEPVAVDILSQVMELDLRLKQNAGRILKVINLPECRESLPAPPKDWWWHLDSKEVNWLIRGLTVITWTGSLGLLANIASRFLTGGVGVLGAAAVVFPSFLTLLQARSELTEAGREGLEKLITKLGIPQYYREEAKLSPLLALSGLLLGFWFALPLISQAYNHEGEKNYEQGQLGAAEENYLRAIALNPDNIYAHHNLGNLYEELQQFDKARTEYLIAVKGDVPEAYNNLARLFIQKKQYPEAVALLKQGLLLQAGQQDSLPEVNYNLFKNLGWARFQQGRDTEAQQALNTAIGIARNLEVAKYYLHNRGSAHCLLAQVLERQKKPGAIQQWQQCCWLGSTLNPDEDTWLHLAQKKLQEAKKSCEQL